VPFLFTESTAKTQSAITTLAIADAVRSYDQYFSGQLEDYEYPAAAIDEAPHHLPKVA